MKLLLSSGNNKNLKHIKFYYKLNNFRHFALVGLMRLYVL